jgi:uncharacterized protein DUF2490
MKCALTVMLLVGALGSVARADDVQVWTAAGTSLIPHRRFELILEPQIRLDDNASRVSSLLFFVGARYQVASWLRATAGYRSEYERDGDDDLVLRHRLTADLGPRLDFGSIRLTYRLRLQEQLRPTSRDQYRVTLRNMLQLSYRGWDRWTPALAAEPFHAMGDLDAFELDKTRITFGVTHDLDKHQEVEAFYRIEVSHGDASEPTLHIVGATYHCDVDLR